MRMLNECLIVNLEVLLVDKAPGLPLDGLCKCAPVHSRVCNTTARVSRRWRAKFGFSSARCDMRNAGEQRERNEGQERACFRLKCILITEEVIL